MNGGIKGPFCAALLFYNLDMVTAASDTENGGRQREGPREKVHLWKRFKIISFRSLGDMCVERSNCIFCARYKNVYKEWIDRSRM